MVERKRLELETADTHSNSSQSSSSSAPSSTPALSPWYYTLPHVAFHDEPVSRTSPCSVDHLVSILGSAPEFNYDIPALHSCLVVGTVATNLLGITYQL